VRADRLAVWTERLAEPQPGRCTIVAEIDGEIIGFAHTVFAEDAVWGSLLDNLHVATAAHRRGVATELMRITAGRVAEAAPDAGLYLWVLEQNARAQAFYDARGGTNAGRERRESVAGTVVAFRYVWRDVAPLNAPSASEA
jgi:ribosomal protein S18 acetylase RimI-like enzyme